MPPSFPPRCPEGQHQSQVWEAGGCEQGPACRCWLEWIPGSSGCSSPSCPSPAEQMGAGGWMSLRPASPLSKGSIATLSPGACQDECGWCGKHLACALQGVPGTPKVLFAALKSWYAFPSPGWTIWDRRNHSLGSGSPPALIEEFSRIPQKLMLEIHVMKQKWTYFAQERNTSF